MKDINELVRETHDLIDQYVKDPVLKKYTPSEWETKHASTPKRQLKLMAQVAKEDAKLKAEYDRDVASKKATHDLIDDVSTWPASVADMFLSVYVHLVDAIKTRHDMYLEGVADFKEKYGESVAKYWSSIADVGRVYTYARRGGGYSYPEPTQENWDYACRMCRGEFAKKPETGEYCYEDPLKKVTDFVECVNEARTLKKLAEADEVKQFGFKAYAMAISHVTGKLHEACSAVRSCFGGKTPTGCEDAHWGGKGEFAGILVESQSAKRISFCSFSAGGWNIQRYHWRYKITELKPGNEKNETKVA